LQGNPNGAEDEPADGFWFGEDFHQQFDAKPGNREYCGLMPLPVRPDFGVGEEE
jgi:hypothetical protein